MNSQSRRVSNNLFMAFCLYISVYMSVGHSQEIDKVQLLKDVETLSSDQMEGRKPPSKGHINAQDYIIQLYSTLELERFSSFPEFKQPFLFSSKQKQGTNILGYIKGSKYPELYWVITAHYDHLGKKGSRIFNGANDNASGVAGMMALARYYAEKTTNFSLIFVATDAEETGLYGAKYFVANPPVSLNSIVLNINLDMIGHGAKRKTLYVAGANKLANVKLLIEDIRPIVKSSGFKLKRHRRGRDRVFSRSLAIDWSKVSDHAAFKRVGIPYLYFGADMNSVYHTVKDDFEHINQHFLFASVSAIIKIIEQLQDLEPNQLSAKSN